MVQDILKKLGFNEKEIDIYLEVLKLGRATPARISKNTGIHRTTIYSAYKGLVKKGVLAEDLESKYVYLIALPPDSLHAILEQRKKRLREEENLINQVLVEISNLPTNIQYAMPKIRFVEELDLEDFLYKRTDEWNKSIKQYDNTWWGFQDHTFIDHYKKWTLDYWKKFESSQNILEKVIGNQSEVEKQVADKLISGREVVFWNKDADFSSSFWIGGDYIIMIYTKNRPFYLIEIYNPVMTHNLREVFKQIWKSLK
ncbi:MAG: helix-turn-helix domain-containing protein [Patescibacteria group bacterium]